MSKPGASGSRLERKIQHTTFHDPEECVQCRMYANHLDGPLLVVTEPYSDLFRDGEYQGRVLQEEEDSRLLKQYRHQLQHSQRQYEESVLMQERFRHRMEAEVALLKDQLIAVQMAYDDVTLPEGVGEVGIPSVQGEGPVEVEASTRTTEDHAPRVQNTHLESQMEVGKSRFDAGDYVSKHEHFNHILRGLRIAEGRGKRNMDIDADVDQYSIMSDSDNEGIRSPITVSSASSSNVPSRAQSVAPQPRGEAQELTLREIYSLLATAFAPGGEEARDRIALLLEDAEQTPLSSRTDAQLFLLRCRNQGRLGFLESHTAHTASSTLRPPSHSELTIDQVISLMAEAAGHSEGTTLEKVNFLFEEAHKTPESMRTPVQLYLLRYWRRPSHLPPTLIPPLSVSPLNHRPITLNIESDTPSAEIFVDASSFGVGFVTSDDRWLAWTFRRGHPEIPQGPDGRIVMSWAEIIAAELGIRTLIAAGYNKTTIMLRSDNFGVVMALYTRRWTSNYGVNEILKRILRLCMSAGLVVMPVWVPSGSNPADGPSRGLYPPSRLKFGYAPEIPPFLQSFISQV